MSKDKNEHLKKALQELHTSILRQGVFDDAEWIKRPADPSEALEMLVSCRGGLSKVIALLAENDQVQIALILGTLNERLGVVRDYLQKKADSLD